MKERLPVNIENWELPKDDYRQVNMKRENSYGYVKFMYLLSMLITLGSILTVIFFGSR